MVKIKKRVLKDNEIYLKDKTKRISIIEGVFNSFHEGFGIKYITPFALALGKNNPHVNIIIGLLTSLPQLLGTISQFWTSRLLSFIQRKYLLTIGVIIQSLLWLLIIFSGFMYYMFNSSSDFSLILLLVSYTLLVTSGSFVSPIWVSLMKDIVYDNRGNFFGIRNRIVGFVAILGSLVAGLLLFYFESINIFYGFVIIFFIAFIFRLLSGLSFLYHYEPKFKPATKSYFSFFSFVKKFIRVILHDSVFL